MKVKATVSFAGAAVSMFPGEVRDIPEEAAAELIGCGYVETVSAPGFKVSDGKDAGDPGTGAPAEPKTAKGAKAKTKK